MVGACLLLAEGEFAWRAAALSKADGVSGVSLAIDNRRPRAGCWSVERTEKI